MAICAFATRLSLIVMMTSPGLVLLYLFRTKTETVAKVNDPLDCYEPTDLNVRYNPPDGLHIFNPHPLVL